MEWIIIGALIVLALIGLWTIIEAIEKIINEADQKDQSREQRLSDLEFKSERHAHRLGRGEENVNTLNNKLSELQVVVDDLASFHEGALNTVRQQREEEQEKQEKEEEERREKAAKERSERDIAMYRQLIESEAEWYRNNPYSFSFNSRYRY